MMRICATTNGDQRVQVLILAVQELSRRQRQCMHQYFELMDRQGLKLPAAKRRQQDTLEKDRTLGRCVERLECSVEVWKDFSLKKKYVTLVNSCLTQNCYQPCARNRVRIQNRGTQADRNSEEER